MIKQQQSPSYMQPTKSSLSKINTIKTSRIPIRSRNEGNIALKKEGNIKIVRAIPLSKIPIKSQISKDPSLISSIPIPTSMPLAPIPIQMTQQAESPNNIPLNEVQYNKEIEQNHLTKNQDNEKNEVIGVIEEIQQQQQQQQQYTFHHYQNYFEERKSPIYIKIPISPKYIEKLPLLSIVDNEQLIIPKENNFKHYSIVLISILCILSI